MTEKKIYFPNLNGLRFIAAALVIISHIEEMKWLFGINTSQQRGIWQLEEISLLGELAVTFFFVLSGFLITYLLLVEKEKTGTIQMKKFYLRRVFRIFPLYYLLIILGLFVFPQFDAFQFPQWSAELPNSFIWKAALLLVLLPNVLAAVAHPVPLISHTWSIGVEEQFYLLWPFLLKKAKDIKNLFLVLILVYLVLAKGVLMASWITSSFQPILAKLAQLLALTRIDCMAIGGIGAWLVFNKHPLAYSLASNRMALGVILLTSISLFFVFQFSFLTHEIYALLFCWIILNLATNPNTFVNLEQPILRYLGKISYGIYMYHFISIRLVLYILEQGGYHTNTLAMNIWLYIGTYAITLLLAMVSYRFFETPFLKWKEKFTVVSSSSG